MPLIAQQAIVTVSGRSLGGASDALQAALQPYSNARVVAITSVGNYVTSWGKVMLMAVIEHD
ncbi:MAG: hypothetical protein V4479_09890 [Actinomycetota bacterium]